MNDADLDRLIGELPELEPPPGLDASILALVAQTPQDPPTTADAPPPALLDEDGEEPLDFQPPANTGGFRWWLLAGPVAAAAIALIALPFLVAPDAGVGDPNDWTPRGEVGAGPGLDLAMVVNTSGTTGRFERGTAYRAGDVLLFRVTAHGAGQVHLVRVDAEGAELLHTQSMAVGASDLTNTDGRVGYALEDGEGDAVFAVIRTDEPLSPALVAESLDVGVDVDAVCSAAWELGARCAAEKVLAVGAGTADDADGEEL